MDIVALDFETSGYAPDSACSLGMVRFGGDGAAATWHHLIRPPSRRVCFTHIHGLTWGMLRVQPSFAELWDEIGGFMAGAGLLVAHNAPFDRAVLEASCAAAGVHAPGIESPMIRVESSVWFDGTGLDGWTEGRDSIWCKNNRAEEAEFVRMDGDGSGAAVEFDGGMLKADEGAWSVLTDLGIVEGSEVRFKVTINGQSAEIVATVAEA